MCTIHGKSASLSVLHYSKAQENISWKTNEIRIGVLLINWRSHCVEMADTAVIVLILTDQHGADAFLLCPHANLFAVLISDLFFSPFVGLLFYAGK